MSPDWLRPVWEIIHSGGPIMIALGLIAFLLYRNILGLFLFTSRLDAHASFFSHTQERTRNAVQDFRDNLSQLVRTQLKYANVLIAAAPLLGLLGTVIGMLDTFKGIGAEAGQDTTKAVADGVKVALITTQTGLMIAIFGLLLTQVISRIYRSKDLQLLELEIQTMKRNLSS
ncbi:transporter, MotA/TolQ/ExbB proton channel family, putative [Verrucomicrobiia bacterium DG1235]|nr:transporter, MotA/TolQ/ExbB proton channel family, putative [Verrucomicrobiae bacterium DG1235]